MKKLVILGTCLLLLLPAVVSAATLTVGNNYSQIQFDEHGTGSYETIGGGSIDPSFLDGEELAWLYCSNSR